MSIDNTVAPSLTDSLALSHSTMEGGLPLFNCLLQQTLRSLCSCSDSSNSSKWVYAVFWKILPRNYPPPKWEYGDTVLDRSKGNKRNWILVWEDGFCDFDECERPGSQYMNGRFGADIFFKMSHEVYNYGEGLVGKVAAENTHKWVIREISPEKDQNLLSSWNGAIDPQPKAWDSQFSSGVQTIAIISVKEGVIQLGSLEKTVEDLNLVINIQRKFSYLQSIPGVFTMQRPYLSLQQPYTFNLQAQFTDSKTGYFVDEKRSITGGKRCYGDWYEEFSSKSINLGWNSPQIGGSSAGGGEPVFCIPPLLPSMSCSFESLLSKLPSVVPSLDTVGAPGTALVVPSLDSVGAPGTALIIKSCDLENETSNGNGGAKTEAFALDTTEEEEKVQPSNPNPSLEGYSEGLEMGELEKGVIIQ